MNDIVYIIYGLFMLIVMGFLFILPSLIYIFLTRFFYTNKVKSIVVRSLPLFLLITIVGYYYYATEKFNYRVYGWLLPGIITCIIAGIYFFYAESKVKQLSLYSSKKTLLIFCLTGTITAILVFFISVNYFPFSFGERNLSSSHAIWKTQNSFQSKEDVLVFINENYAQGTEEQLLDQFTWADVEEDLVEIEFMGKKGFELLRDEDYIRIHMVFLENGRVMKHIRIYKSV